MKAGLWVWPSDSKSQRKTARSLVRSKHLVQAISALSKSKDGLSNSELDDALADNSNWMTLWVVRQLTSLGFIEYRVDYFGEPAKYRLTDLGKSLVGPLTGQPSQKQPAPPQATVART